MINPAVVGALKEAATPILHLLLNSQPVIVLITGLMRLVDEAVARHRIQEAAPPGPGAGNPRN